MFSQELGRHEHARIVREVEAMIRAGIDRDPFGATQARDPDWTRGGRDRASAELGLRGDFPGDSQHDRV